MNRKQKKELRQRQSTRQLMGIVRVTPHGIVTDSGERVFFLIQPDNLSVLSPEVIRGRVRSLTMLLSTQPSLEILALDSRESFQRNKEYYLRRLEEEMEPVEKDGDWRKAVEDALNATRAAVEEGYLPGGGVSYIRAAEALKNLKGENDDETTGIHIIARAIEEPLRQIAQNAGVDGSVIIQKIRENKGDFGYNARTDEYVNMLEAGVIDPTKVARVALENAASVAGMFLTTECGIVDIPEKEPAAPAMPAGGMM